MSKPKYKIGEKVEVKNVDTGIVCDAFEYGGKWRYRVKTQRIMICAFEDVIKPVGGFEDCAELEEQYEEQVKQDNKDDMVNAPKHYTQNGDNECIDVMRWLFGDEAVMAFCRCNIFKYRFRAGLKNGETDINKAVWYENYLHKMLQEQSNGKDLR